MKKLLVALVCGLFVLSANAVAKPDKSEKVKKQKQLPPGLQKKLERGGELPPGWKKKVAKGEVIDQDILDYGVILKDGEYPKRIKKTVGSEIYKVQDKIIKVANATKVILDVFEVK